MADAYFVSINRYQAPALVVVHAAEPTQDPETLAEVLLIPPDDAPVFYRTVYVERSASLPIMQAAALALAHDEAADRISGQPSDSRPDTVAFQKADEVVIAGRRSLGQYPGVDALLGPTHFDGVRKLLQSFQGVRGVKVHDQ